MPSPLLLLLLLLPVPGTTQPTPSVVAKPRRAVCVSQYLTYAVCGPNGTDAFTGYEPEVGSRGAAAAFAAGQRALRDHGGGEKVSST
eukprot:365067-Chlamydomonas_euryale.AAC.9